MPLKEYKENFPINVDVRRIDALYWRPPGGESIADVRMRVRSLFDTLHRECEGQSVVVVTHGEFMSAARASLEYMSDEQWVEYDRDKSQKILNTHVYHYSRRHPETGEIGKYLEWRRSICPWKESTYTGWQIVKRRRFTNEELLEQVKSVVPVVKSTLSV